MRYVEQLETEVLDTSTNLVWQSSYKTNLKFEEALAYATQLSKETGREWRVPTVEELSSLLDRTRRVPASSFPNMPAIAFWSSSPYVGNASYAWFVSFNNGNVDYNFRLISFAVRLVRGAIPRNKY
jgi:hypothetical protein